MPCPWAERWSDRGHLRRAARAAGDSWRARLHAGAPQQAEPATASDSRELWRDAKCDAKRDAKYVWPADTARYAVCPDAPRRPWRGPLRSATRRDAAATGIPAATAAGL